MYIEKNIVAGIIYENIHLDSKTSANPQSTSLHYLLYLLTAADFYSQNDF